MSSSPVRVALLGLGAINTRVVELLHARQSAVSIVGVVVRRPQLPPLPALEGAKRIGTPAELTELSGSSDSAVRLIALSIIANAPDKKAAAPVVKKLSKDKDESVRRAAKSLLAELKVK